MKRQREDDIGSRAQKKVEHVQKECEELLVTKDAKGPIYLNKAGDILAICLRLDAFCEKITGNWKCATPLLILSTVCKSIKAGLQQVIYDHFFYRPNTDVTPSKFPNLIADALCVRDEWLTKHMSIHRLIILNYHNPHDVHVPPSVTQLSFLPSFTKLLHTPPKPIPLPILGHVTCLTHLFLPETFNSKLSEDSFPPSLTHIQFGPNFDQSIDHVPQGITHLKLGVMFSHPIPSFLRKLLWLSFFIRPAHQIESLPPSLCYLRIELPTPAQAPELSLSALPPSLTHLHVDLKAFRRGPTVFPPKLQYLSVRSIDLPLDFSLLPPLLTHLHVTGQPDWKDQPLPLHLVSLHLLSLYKEYRSFHLPLSIHDHVHLTTLTLPIEFNDSVDFLPRCLLHLFINDGFSRPVENLPPNLKTLKIFSHSFFHKLEHLPQTLTELAVGYIYNQPLDSLPPSLHTLSIHSSHFDHPLDSLPPSLHTLSIDSAVFNHPLDSLPPSLRILSIYSPKFFRTIFALPPNLETLALDGFSFSLGMAHLPASLTRLEAKGLDTPLPLLPEGLTHLTLGDHYNFPNLLLPEGLQELNLGQDYNHPIASLPPTLKTLKLGNKFNQPLLQLPSTLAHLQLDQTYVPLLDSKRLVHLGYQPKTVDSLLHVASIIPPTCHLCMNPLSTSTSEECIDCRRSKEEINKIKQTKEDWIADIMEQIVYPVASVRVKIS